MMETTPRRYSSRVLEHLAHPTGVGRLAEPDGRGEAGSASCGDLVKIELALEKGRLKEASFLAYGCPAAIAGASETVGSVRGRTVLEAAALGNEEVARRLELSPEKRDCSNIAADALHSALEDLLRTEVPLRPPGSGLDPRGVLVGMSGGVDSTVAALRLRDQSYHVVGATFRLWSDPVCATGPTCCSPEAIQEARRQAHSLGLPHLTVDLTADFYREVVEQFVAEYEDGRTPNPCVRCNGSLRFAELAALADRLGLAWIATGHYARTQPGSGLLRRGTDPGKDQSYVLAAVAPHLLARSLFPLGDLAKPQTRALAREAALPVYDSPESQEICFVPDNDYRRFLRERLGERGGRLVTAEGRIVGEHRGLYNFTVGQRKGLGLAGPEPYYVVALVPERDEVIVGPAKAAEIRRVRVRRLVRHLAPLPTTGTAQLRSSGGEVPCRVTDKGDELILELREPVRGVAPGQTAVVYQEDKVAAAGIITQTLPGPGAK